MIRFKFLLVDDEKSFVEVLAQRLRQRGFEVFCAFSGEEALSQLETDDDLDIVVMDLKMPHLDGIQMMKKLKKQYPLLEVIMLTGNSTIPSAVEAMKLGAFAYLEKPCELDQLISKADQAVTRKREREAKIFNIRTKPYITKQERDDQISKVLSAE